jgi:cystathionine gamma-synthase
VTARGKELYPLLKSVQIAGGGVASPWDSWLVLRGMRTLHVRVGRQCKTALSLAEYLEEKMHDSNSDGEDNDSSSPWMSEVAVKAVHYPGLASHPQHAIASKQMVLATAATGDKSSSCYGGVLSFELDTELEATAFAAALRVCQRATSLGGTETLVEHRASIEPPGAVVSPSGLLRVSVGLEDASDLIRDFEEAFAVVAEVMMEANA